MVENYEKAEGKRRGCSEHVEKGHSRGETECDRYANVVWQDITGQYVLAYIICAFKRL